MKGFIPGRKAIESLLKLTEYVEEAAEHLYKSFAKLVKEAKLEDMFKDFLPALQRFWQGVRAQCQISIPFGGQRVIPIEEKRALTQSVSAKPEISQGDRNLTYEITTTPEGTLNEHYRRSDGKEVSPAVIAYLRGLFVGWLAQCGMVSTDNGLMSAPDKDGQQKQLQATDLMTAMNHNETGFGKYVEGNGIVGFSITAKVGASAAPAADAAATRAPGQNDTPSSSAGAGGGH